ncbi:MAG: GlsB/YeaQ/YmgE family stress response membrane protein [Candidatus Dasytiphilus stammeri]
MDILVWILFGLITGILAKWLMPGQDGGGIIITILLGIAGAVVGGWISTFLGLKRVNGFNIGSFLISIVGSIIILLIYRMIKNYI